MKKDVTHIPICRRSVEERLSRTLKMTLPYVLNSDFPALPLGHGEHAHVNYLACRGKVRPPSYPLIFFFFFFTNLRERERGVTFIKRERQPIRWKQLIIIPAIIHIYVYTRNCLPPESCQHAT